MTERSSSPDGPDDWGSGGYARGQYYGSGTSGSYGAAKSGGYDARAADLFGARPADPFGDRAGAAYGAGTAGVYDASAYGAGTDGTYGAGTDGAGFAGTGTEVPTATMPAASRRRAADAKGFLGALFDFGFTSFVTPKVIKVLYRLIMIGTVVTALAFTISMFRVSATLGIVTLVFGAPLFVLIVLAIYRIILEFFMVAFRIADDIEALRERGDVR